MLLLYRYSLPLGLTGFPRGATSLKDKQEMQSEGSGAQDRETSLTITRT